MQRGQNYYGIMLVCVLCLAAGSVFLLSQAPAAMGASLSQAQASIGGKEGLVSRMSGENEGDLLVRKRTGNVAQDSVIPCCANARQGCGEGIANCTYSSGDGLSCFSLLFDTKSGSCA
jgi:hypothetical protein